MLELVLIVHFAFIAWVVTGGLLAIKRCWAVWFHLPALVWGVLLEWYGWICPLTPLENELRVKRGLSGYDGGFIEHYLVPVIYPEGLTPDIQVGLAVGLVMVNLIAYGFVIRGNFRKQKRANNG